MLYHPEFVAVVLAATNGARLFPLTTNIDYMCLKKQENKEEDIKHYRKHLLPIGNKCVLNLLLKNIESSGFEECIIVIQKYDIETRDLINNTVNNSKCKISIVTVDERCEGSAEALRVVASSNLLGADSNVVVIPGDLILEGKGALGNLCDVHRRNANGCTILMSDSSQQDDSSNNEFNLKESFKNKRGGIPRHAEDIEYVALTLKEQKIILKKSHVDVEEDMGDGSTPKLLIPKIRLLGETSNIFCSLDLNDLHVYVFSPWMLEALRVRSSVVNLQNEF